MGLIANPDTKVTRAMASEYRSKWKGPLLLHLPLIGMLSILGFFALVDAGYLAWFRTESTFGWMVVFWYPLSALLGLTQVVLWTRYIYKRGIISTVLTRRTRPIVLAGLLIIVATLLCLFAFRATHRWGLTE